MKKCPLCLMSSSSEGSPEYPRMVWVSDETGHEGQLTGVYKKREKSNDYVHKNGVFELNYRGIIIIVIIVSIKCVPGLPAGGVWCIRDNISCKPVTGWDFTSDHFVWPNTDKLYIRDFPASITIESTGPARTSIPAVMGRYEKEERSAMGRPVYRGTGENKDYFIFYSSK